MGSIGKVLLAVAVVAMVAIVAFLAFSSFAMQGFMCTERAASARWTQPGIWDAAKVAALPTAVDADDDYRAAWSPGLPFAPTGFPVEGARLYRVAWTSPEGGRFQIVAIQAGEARLDLGGSMNVQVTATFPNAAGDAGLDRFLANTTTLNATGLQRMQNFLGPHGNETPPYWGWAQVKLPLRLEELHGELGMPATPFANQSAQGWSFGFHAKGLSTHVRGAAVMADARDGVEVRWDSEAASPTMEDALGELRAIFEDIGLPEARPTLGKSGWPLGFIPAREC